MKPYLLCLLLFLSPAFASELVLLEDSTSEYQIVFAEDPESEAITKALAQCGRLLQSAFQANGVELPLLSEAERDPAKPALLLGATAFAREHGIDPSTLEDWSYLQKAVGQDLILAGHDHPAQAESGDQRRPPWARVGTAKAVADFAREFMGVRFLYPDLPSYTPVAGAEKIDLLESPAIEYIPMKSISVPADLTVTRVPLLRVNTAHPAGGGFYDLAHSRFPRVDELFGGHTWERAIPRDLYDQHPEYFALVNGTRLKPEGKINGQYCLSNPEVQELIYRDCATHLDRGYGSVDLGQPDGFRECQCDPCAALYDTGKDWSEKIWIFHRQVAERLEQSHPGRQVTIMSYILTAQPPKSFQSFPANTSIMLTGTNEEDIAPWRGVEVPRGFTGYLYNWCPNLGTRYTPMRTPGFIETQVKRLVSHHIRSIYRDGPGQLFGLEGPVYYVMGRMFDDPEINNAPDLLSEFYEAAFVDPSTIHSMRSFYDQLYNAIALYSDHLGTRCDLWTSVPMDGVGRPRKTVTDPFQLMAFLYPPKLLAGLEADLARAEKSAKSEKTKTRLALVRREFDYLQHFVRVVHLYQAFELVPDLGARDRLLDAIDARNAYIDSLFDERGRAKAFGPWSQVLFPYPGHNVKHLQLAQDGYQEPYANTCFNWDTTAMRSAPLPGKKTLRIARATGPITLDTAQWQETEAQALTLIPPLHTLPLETTFRLLYDSSNLYLLAECELEENSSISEAAWKRDRLPQSQEVLEIYLQPQLASEVFYRFASGVHPESKYDAVAGRISDVMDPRYGQDDPTWDGEWSNETRLDKANRSWKALITIPFKTLELPAPTAGTVWRGNFARHHLLPRGKNDDSIWSSTLHSSTIEDRSLFGELTFE